jgi:EAL domain-containing protein (putative c-di-GMP-specific phosphodiesterase class I)/CheY-like chemotaxis protein
MPERRTRNVLIVDDDHSQQRLVARIAERAGFRPATASGVPEGLMLLGDDADFAIAVLDLSLGDRDGLELIGRLAKLRIRPAVAFVSGFNERIRVASQRYAQSLGLRVLGSLGKPIDPTALLAVLGKVVLGAFTPDMAEPPMVTERELAAAIADGRIWAAFEPKIMLATGELASAEALARWTTAEGVVIPPLSFIPVAEECELIGTLTLAVMDQALAALRTWQRHRPVCTVAVNISPVLLRDPAFPERIEASLRRHGVSPESVVLEITESVILPNSSHVIEGLTRLRIRGFGLSIDDFGTGHSSLLSVMRLPFSELKIDQAFVRDAETDPDARKIVFATASLAHELGLRCVAEGVETKSAERLLQMTSCEMAQGRLYGPVLNARQVEEWLARA